MRQQAQALHFNRSGYARTRDKEMVTIAKCPAGARGPRGGFGGGYTRHVPKPRQGTGGAKKWTGSAICQAAWAPPEQPGRTASKAEGASQGHTRHCPMFTGGMIEECQNENGKRVRTESLDEPLEYYMTNNMFDETKLYVAAPGGHRAKRRRTLA